MGAILGVLVSATSVGAGAIGVTALVVLYPRRRTAVIVGSDIAHAVPLTLVAGIGHWIVGSVDWHLMVSLLCGSISWHRHRQHDIDAHSRRDTAPDSRGNAAAGGRAGAVAGAFVPAIPMFHIFDIGVRCATDFA